MNERFQNGNQPEVDDGTNNTKITDPATTDSQARMYGMGVYYELHDLPTLIGQEDELVIFGDGLHSISEVWLHPSPTCELPKDNRSVAMTIGQTTKTFIVASLAKEEDFRPEWMHPIFLCTEPEANPSEFRSVIILDTSDPWLPLLIVLYFWFLLMSALFTGLNLALMSLDLDDLRRIREYDENPKTRRYAANIIPIRENGNFMLCTIILGNTICNAICVLTFDRMTRGLVMTLTERMIFINIIPTLFIMFFSEVIPQVICTKYALPIGSRCRHLMVFFMVLTFPASYPLSKLLDYVVGKEIRMTIDRRMLGDLMRQQQQKYETVNMADVLENAMNLQVRRVRDVMTPIEKIIGVLNVKDLLLIDDSLDLHVGIIMQLWNRSTLLMLELKRGFPLAIVVDYLHDAKCYQVIGIVTLEDNLEEVIGEIYDEKDRAIEENIEKVERAIPQSLPQSEIHLAPELTVKIAKKRMVKKALEVCPRLEVITVFLEGRFAKMEHEQLQKMSLLLSRSLSYRCL
ncbi:unnamed protein product [Haemonchus placei]|uniref:CNNM transmembrane domain-containing protein n=1 Tax=Haemonchus placei TaxID=6290 RepID=A0A158QR65_HAEPC|nr:unnamed protein product [Haemonchus placei]